MTKEKVKKEHRSSVDEEIPHFLMIFNDDYHTFDYVIDALMDICGHQFEQASQCTMLIHFKGKCDVKKGNLSVLNPMKNALLSKNLKARIE